MPAAWAAVSAGAARRRRVFIAGIALFTVASFLGGLATSSGWLLAGRALQGVGAAVAAPTALSLITTNFAEGRERNRAFGVFSAVAVSGGAIGLLAGGMLTSWLSWRWVLFVNVPIGILLAVLAPLYITESARQPGRFDLAGALTSTVGSFTVAVVLLAAFFRIETRTRQPITPLHLFADRTLSQVAARSLPRIGPKAPADHRRRLRRRRPGVADPGLGGQWLPRRHPRPHAGVRPGHGPAVRAVNHHCGLRRASA